MRRIHQIPFQAILQRREYAISQHAKLRVTNIGVYGLTLVMKVPQLARMTRGAFGIRIGVAQVIEGPPRNHNPRD